MIYSIPYVLLILFYAILAWFYRSSNDEWKSRLRIVCVFVFMFFFGFRGFVGEDWTNYYPAFQKMDNLDFSFYSLDESTYEPGFTLLMWLCKKTFDSFAVLVFICCAINCFLLFRFLDKRVDNVPLALVFFCCMGGLVLQTNLMRNSISILLFVNALTYLEQRKPIPYFLICTLAISFHSSSILYFPLYFFFHQKCPKWLFLSIFVFGNTIFLLHIHFITPFLSFAAGRLGEGYQKMVELYMDAYGDKIGGLSVGYLERLLTGILIFCYYNKLTTIRKENVIFINAYIAYFALYFFFNELLVVAERLATLFVFFYWIIWGDLLKCFALRNNKILFIGFLSIYCVLKMVGMTRLITLQYDNVLLGAKSYEERLYIHEKNRDNE